MLQNFTKILRAKSSVKFLTMKISLKKEIESYNYKNRDISNVIKLNIKRV